MHARQPLDPERNLNENPAPEGAFGKKKDGNREAVNPRENVEGQLREQTSRNRNNQTMGQPGKNQNCREQNGPNRSIRNKKNKKKRDQEQLTRF